MMGRAWPAAALVALALASAAFVRGHAAPAYYFASDQQVYLAIARAPFSNDRMVHHGSGSWRLLPSLLARDIGMPLGGPERGFLVLTFTTFALLPLAAWVWLDAFGVSRCNSVIGAAVIAVPA